jgi:hypothetical protein
LIIFEFGLGTTRKAGFYQVRKVILIQVSVVDLDLFEGHISLVAIPVHPSWKGACGLKL